MKKGGWAKVSGNTNRLVIEETDLTLPGKNGLDVVIKRSMIIKIIMKHIVITEITMMMDQIIITM